MFGVSILDVVKKIFSLIPLDLHYIESLQKTKFEKDVVLNEALYDKVCFVGFQIEKFKKMYSEYRFYDVENSEQNYVKGMWVSLKPFDIYA